MTWGRLFTGDIPTFVKTDADSRREDDLFDRWIQTLPADVRGEWESLLEEMNAQKTGEAKLYKALDRLEAVIQHNESDIDTWLPLEIQPPADLWGGKCAVFSLSAGAETGN